MSFQLKNKSKFHSQDWLLRLKIDQAKAQEEYFKYYPELHPDPKVAATATNKNQVSLNSDYKNYVYNIYCAMDDTISQLALAYYKTDIHFIRIYQQSRPLHSIRPDDLSVVIKTYLLSGDSQDTLRGMALFNGLSEEQQNTFIDTYNCFSSFSTAMLALHDNVHVAKVTSDRIAKSKDVALIELLAYNHDKGISTISKDDMVDTFVQDFLKGKESTMKLPLIKKNAKKLQEALTPHAPILSKLSERWGHHGARYALNILAKKDLDAAKALVKKIPSLEDPSAIREIGETLLLTPEATNLRQNIYKTAFRTEDTGYHTSEYGKFGYHAIAHNQVRSFAHFFALVAKQYPEEWSNLCKAIATDKFYLRIAKKRDYFINETIKKEYWYGRRGATREEGWRERQAFDAYFVSAMLIAHVAYGAPLHDAKNALTDNMDMALTERILDLKEFASFKDHIPMVKAIYPDANSVELAKQFWESINNTNVDMIQEIDIMMDF